VTEEMVAYYAQRAAEYERVYATGLTYQELRCFWTLQYAVA